MKTKLFVALTAFVVVFAACEKDDNDTTDNGSTTEDYQPTSAGSTWQYTSSSSGSYTEIATGGDTTISGQTFFAFDNTASGRRYVNKNNGIYTSYGYVPQIDTSLTLLYLKDADAGTTWNNVGQYSGIPVTLTYTIASRDGEKTVNGTNFKNVIALDYSISAPNPLTGQSITLGTGQQFYAKGVGAITSTIHIGYGTIQVDDSTYLTSYTIK